VFASQVPEEQLPMEELDPRVDLTYSERPVWIIYHRMSDPKQGYLDVQGPVESPHKR
jgi:hypothetical protein